MPDLTICIPIGPYHEQIVTRAMDSVKAQTVAVAGVAYHDDGAKGAGYARNQMLSQVRTPFVAFLDADDWLEPEFASVMVEATASAGLRYVYSDWYEDTPQHQEAVKEAPARCYCFDNGWQVHLVTAVIRTDWLRAIGGFDETLPGMEDTDMFHRLHDAGHCGQRVPVPLVHYRGLGERSRTFEARADRQDIKEKIGRKYNRGSAMPCCQGEGVKNEGPFGEQQPGDVLAELQGPPRITVGIESRRIYPRQGYGARCWVDPRDAMRDPMRFKLVPQPLASPKVEQPPLQNVGEIAETFEGWRTDGAHVYLPQNDAPPTPIVRATPSQIRKLAGY